MNKEASFYENVEGPVRTFDSEFVKGEELISMNQKGTWKMNDDVKAIDKNFEVNPGPLKTNKLINAQNHYAVFIRLNIFQISEIDTVGCTFLANFYLTATWRDPNLDYETLSNLPPEEQSKAIQESFDPKLMFMNTAENPEYKEDPMFQLEKWMRGWDGSPAVCVRFELTARFREQFELQSFPLDAQPLNIIISSHNHSDVLSLHGNKKYSRLRTEFMVLNEFVPSDVQFCRSRTIRKTDIGYPLLYTGVVVTRKHGYYSWNVFLPTFLITLMSVATYAVPVEEVADRCSVILTLVLTSVAFKFVVSQDLPKISYNTYLDIYVLISFISLTLITLGAVLTYFCGAHVSEEFAKDLDWVMFCLFLALFIIWNSATFVKYISLVGKREQCAIGPSAEALSTGRIGLGMEEN